jgi:hypothetical protein
MGRLHVDDGPKRVADMRRKGRRLFCCFHYGVQFPAAIGWNRPRCRNVQSVRQILAVMPLRVR